MERDVYLCVCLCVYLCFFFRLASTVSPDFPPSRGLLPVKKQASPPYPPPPVKIVNKTPPASASRLAGGSGAAVDAHRRRSADPCSDRGCISLSLSLSLSLSSCNSSGIATTPAILFFFVAVLCVRVCASSVALALPCLLVFETSTSRREVRSAARSFHAVGSGGRKDGCG